MARLGVLKPLRGTESSLANVVLDEGEIAFAYPSTGPGTGYGGIKMGDGVKTFANLDWYINGDPWEYDEGTDEAALLHNIERCDRETIGKIYYIQAYYHNSSSQYTHAEPVISQDMPYMVIGINRDGTENTVDLMSLVAANYLKWNSNTGSWSYGKYTTSNIYSWLSTTCPNGYSLDIQSYMVTMTEIWREATGNATGTKQTRTTKCKILNPIELFGYSSATYSPTWEYATSSDHRTDFDTKYGRIYPVWTDSTAALTNRRIFHDKAMGTPSYAWSNSWLAFSSSNNRAACFIVYTVGSCGDITVYYAYGVAPVIRLSQSAS